MASLVDIYAKLRTLCRDAGGQAAWGKKAGVSPAYISDVLNGRKPPGPKILAAVGYRAVTIYERDGNE
jgi:hypothetical protein